MYSPTPNLLTFSGYVEHNNLSVNFAREGQMPRGSRDIVNAHIFCNKLFKPKNQLLVCSLRPTLKYCSIKLTLDLVFLVKKIEFLKMSRRI